MRRAVIAVLFLFLGAGALRAQDEVLPGEALPGEALPGEALSFEERHQDKEAIILEDSMVLTLNPDWSYRKEWHKKIKVLKEGGRSVGEMQVGFDKERDTFVDFSAHTVTPDGKRHRYTKIQDISPYESYAQYSDAMMRIVTMPEVNIGSVIEMDVVMDNKGKPVKDAFWEVIYLARETPVELLRVKVVLPKELDVRYKAFGLTQEPVITEDEGTVTYSWERRDVYKEPELENYLPPPTAEEAADVAEFSSIKSWGDVARWYYGLIRENLKMTPEIAAASRKAVEGQATVRDKTRAILEYIQDNFRYVSMSFGDNALVPHPTDEVFANKYGDCKDLSLLCMVLLKEAGIASDMVLFGDEYSMTDPREDLPLPAVFDHVLLLVHDPAAGDFYADPLLKGYDIGEYPLYYQNAYVFVITQDGGRHDRLPIFPEERNSDRTGKRVTINPDGSALTEGTSVWELDESISLREGMKRLDDVRRAYVLEQIELRLAEGGEVLEHRRENEDTRYGLYKIYVKVRQRDAFPADDGFIIINVPGYGRSLDFVTPKRKNPIFFSGNSLSETVSVYKVPKGFRVLSLPRDIDKDVGYTSLKRTFERDKDTITIKEVSRFRRTLIPAEDYERVREFYDGLPRATEQRIILQKHESFWSRLIRYFERLRQAVMGFLGTTLE